MPEQSLEVSITHELTQITDVLEGLAGRRSRWSGRVEVIANAPFQGAKRYDCSIVVNEEIARHPVLRWRTLIHEALHALSPAYTRMQFDALRGWEEGVVEKLQRLLRAEVLAVLNINVSQDEFIVVEARHSFNSYIAVLDGLCQELNMDERTFYLLMLKTDLPQRVEVVAAFGARLEDGQAAGFRRSLLLAHAKLSRGPSYEP